jgi:hypothetical protein
VVLAVEGMLDGNLTA